MSRSYLRIATVSAGITLFLSAVIGASVAVSYSHPYFPDGEETPSNTLMSANAQSLTENTADSTPSGAHNTSDMTSNVAGTADTPPSAPAPLSPAPEKSSEELAENSPKAPNPTDAETSADCLKVPCVALTFDDGPDANVTPRILDTLKKKHAIATFFQMGRHIAGNENLLKRAIADGHILGTHTWDHPQLPQLYADDIRWQINSVKDASESITGVRPTLMRPPYGLFNNTVLSLTEQSDDAVIMWDVDTEDWKNLDAKVTTERALSAAHPGAIILMHDVHPSTADALGGIIDGLRNAGYTLVSIPHLVGEITPGEVYYHGLSPE